MAKKILTLTIIALFIYLCLILGITEIVEHIYIIGKVGFLTIGSISGIITFAIIIILNQSHERNN